ncbi:hypothetical protein AVEN_84691-1 [Araneus ventricosus]|uniref:Integrase catalytic domain-containing protein n=1 Tax=Araneus ventricosus TaxID=182803 RepID=A0A4Y2ITZ9_ARAVE|nr:hypothetical protein AVEN_84691-1 [Araneus ventricosus]
MFDAPRSLRLGDGRCMYAKGIGDIQVEILVKGKWNPVPLTNVWYVPGSRQNLFSSGAALKQNGVIERENRIIMEAAGTVLHAKDLPEKLWAEAVNTAAYVLNRTRPTPEAGKSPYEIWFKRKSSSVDHLKIFGSECFFHIPKQK